MAKTPANFTQSEIDRAVKAAEKVGRAVEIKGGVIRIIPYDGDSGEKCGKPIVKPEEINL